MFFLFLSLSCLMNFLFLAGIEELERAPDDGPDGSPGDVFLLCKQFMHSSTLTQKPTLILPASRIQLVDPEPKMVLPKNKLSDRQIAEFRKTATAISEPPWSLLKASRYLTALCDDNVLGNQGVPPQLVYFLTPADALENLQRARDNAGPPEDILNFAPGTPRKVVATLRAVTGERQQHQAKGRGRGKGRGRKGRQNLCPEPVEPAQEIEEVAHPQNVPADPPAPEIPEQPPQKTKRQRMMRRPAAAVESSDAAQPAAAAAALERDVEAPPVPAVDLAVAAPSGKHYRESTINLQSSLGSKCKYAAKGCKRCIEIHNLWKARNARDVD